MKASIMREIGSISEDELMRVHISYKNPRNVWTKEGNISNISCYEVRYVINFLCNCTQL